MPTHARREFHDEFLSLAREHDAMLATIETIWRRQQAAYAFDESTGLARGQPFRSHLCRLLANLEAGAVPAIGVLFLDLNHFKQVNDVYGHAAGDRALGAVGNILREALRVDRMTDLVMKADAFQDYSVARHGGDEFLVALELKEPGDIEPIATRLKRRVEDLEQQRAHGHDAPVRLTSAVGGVVYERQEASPDLPLPLVARELVALADAQMYRSKEDDLVHIAKARFDQGRWALAEASTRVSTSPSRTSQDSPV